MHKYDLARFDGRLVVVTFKDGHKAIGKLQRDLTDRCWELLRAEPDNTSGRRGVGEILFMQDVASIEEFTLRK